MNSLSDELSGARAQASEYLARIEQLEAEILQGIEDRLGPGPAEDAGHRRVDHVDGQTDRHGLAVSQAVVAEFFQLVRGPVTEIQRPRVRRLEWVAAVDDVP